MYESAMRVCPSLGKVPPDMACCTILKAMQKSVGNFQDMGKGAGWWNVYNIYDMCSDMPHLLSNEHEFQWLLCGTPWHQQLNETPEHSASWVCGGMLAITRYFNREDVQKAIHVGRTTKWTTNDDCLQWNHPKAGISFLGEIRRLAQKYTLLVYSGDVDAQIPHTSSEAWTSSLGFVEVAPYQMW